MEYGLTMGDYVFSYFPPSISEYAYSPVMDIVYIPYITYPIVTTQFFAIESLSLCLLAYISFYIMLHYLTPKNPFSIY